MIEKLVLRNFQAHKKCTIVFDPKITVVVGDSDVGKSAIIRALSWVILNRPDGDSFINWNADTATAMLHVDGKVILRTRGKGGNHYQLDDTEFTAFGKGVPEKVTALLRTADINLQEQHASVFWFSESAGEVSRQLNAIINLSVIDDALGDIGAQVRKAKAALEICEERTKQAKERRNALVYIVEVNEQLEKVEAIEQKHIELVDKRTSLQKSVDAYTAHASTAKTARQEAAQSKILLQTAKDAMDAAQANAKLQQLMQNLASLRKATKQTIPDIEPLTKLRNEFEVASLKRNNLESALQNLRVLWTSRKNTRIEADTAHEALHEKTEGYCPICGGSLK